jgi:hypothetical protein
MITQETGSLNRESTSGSVEDSSFRLLIFFRKYPHAWFNRLAVVQALQYSDLRTVENALNNLIKDDKIKIKTCNNTTLYTLKSPK